MYYGKEPFDLRLTILRMFRNLHIILGITLVGVLLLGGGYYVKNVVLYDDTTYRATSTYKISFENEPVATGDYYINEMTWNTYLHSGKFMDAVWEYLHQSGAVEFMEEAGSAEGLTAYAEVKLESDIHVPFTIVTTPSEQWTFVLAKAIENTMTTSFVEGNEQLASVEVIDPVITVQRVMPYVRPVRAFVLSGIISVFFAVVWFMLKELTECGIWLPSALNRKYGIPVVGTINSVETAANVKFLFAPGSKIAVCPADERIDSVEVIDALKQLLSDSDAPIECYAMPAPLLCTESVCKLKEAEGVLLVVRAGKSAGKPMEYILEYLSTQKIEVTAILLWDADEWLINTYYMGGNTGCR